MANDAPLLASLVGGRRLEGGPPRDVRNPFDGSVVARLSCADGAVVEQALTTASAGARRMAASSSHERSEILTRASRLLEERKDAVALDLCLEAGKPIRDARAEVERCILTLKACGAEALAPRGELLALDASKATLGRMGLTKRYPLGVVTAISPFNFPLNLPAHKVGPALAAGNAVILKPAPRTPRSADHLVKVLLEAGCPDEALTLDHADPDAVAPLVEDPRVRMVSFTGSAAVGWDVKARAVKKRVTLELGGNAAAIVHADADLDHAVARCVAGSFTYAGQVCIRSQRIFVHDSLLTAFADRFAAKAAALRRGDPRDEKTEIGPMIDAAAAARAHAWVREAVDAGAGQILGGAPDGAFLPPTILTGVPRRCKAYAEEIFAPVVTLEGYETLDDAFDAVNASRFGLQAGIFTNELSAVMRAFEALEVGGVVHDDVPMFRSDVMPYGGVKESGFGREGVRYAIEDMSEPRILVVRTRR
jgi:acyl-CoA reductase-like NAD-dependent aldehyde dehydrogenase